MSAVAGSITPFSLGARAMGGRLVIHLAIEDERREDARLALERIGRWAARLNRHSASSELLDLNADPHSAVMIGPTLASALAAGQVAAQTSAGLVDITLLDARLAAEQGAPALAVGPRAWTMRRGRRGTATVVRAPGLHFDLDGVGKGLLADRALALLGTHPNAVVDAGGDLAIRVAPGRVWEIAVADPRDPAQDLCVLRIAYEFATSPVRLGVATSGTLVQRWVRNGRVSHHLIDPRTGAPAVTDVLQATVIAESAQRAEALAKAAVIAGSVAGLELLERSEAAGAVLLTESGVVLSSPSTIPFILAD
jgi:thiamine biosynthesis lipoprotein